MNNYAVVAVGYNRADGMLRLLKSLNDACYDNDNVTLIVSIDNSGSDAVEQAAASFEWNHGKKQIVTYPERQGLRKHILHCGDFIKDYEAIAVFEDDVVAAPGFYCYMKETVNKYKDNDKIAGISLYNHMWNVHTNMPFEPAFTQYDVYFLQFAQSWGQIWMKKQWLDFISWYLKNNEEFKNLDNIPASVCGWPKTSWLKYHIKYCIEKDKYFVYPYKALSTCFSDVGEHCIRQDTHLQVPMLSGIQETYRLLELNDKDSVIYDAFFERIFFNRKISGIDSEQICVNLYGTKKSFEGKKYLLSMKQLPYKKKKSYGLQYKPHEQNVLCEIEGNDIFLYDITEKGVPDKRNTEVLQFRYRFRIYGKTVMLLKCVWDKILSKITGK